MQRLRRSTIHYSRMPARAYIAQLDAPITGDDGIRDFDDHGDVVGTWMTM